MDYYNALVYMEYGAVMTYHNITNLDGFLAYIKANYSYTKIFLYRKQRQKDERGVYCAFNFPNMQGFRFK